MWKQKQKHFMDTICIILADIKNHNHDYVKDSAILKQ